MLDIFPRFFVAVIVFTDKELELTDVVLLCSLAINPDSNLFFRWSHDAEGSNQLLEVLAMHKY